MWILPIMNKIINLSISCFESHLNIPNFLEGVFGKKINAAILYFYASFIFFPFCKLIFNIFNIFSITIIFI